VASDVPEGLTPVPAGSALAASPSAEALDANAGSVGATVSASLEAILGASSASEAAGVAVPPGYLAPPSATPPPVAGTSSPAVVWTVDLIREHGQQEQPKQPWTCNNEALKWFRWRGENLPIDRRVGRPAGRPAGRPVGRAVGRQVDRCNTSLLRPADRQTDWSRLVGRPVGRPVGRLAGRRVGRSAGWSVGRCNSSSWPVDRSTD